MVLKITEAHATEETKRKLIEVIDENLDAFAENDDDLGKTDLVQHTIVTDGSPGIRLKARQIPYAAPGWADQELDRMEKLLIISIADAGLSPYAAPIVIVPKKDATWRMCVVYRGLNEQTIKDA